MYWVAISSSSPKEKEEKWLTLINHIANVHVHENNELFKVCTHELIERQWLKKGNSAHVLRRFFSVYLCIFYTYTRTYMIKTLPGLSMNMKYGLYKLICMIQPSFVVFLQVQRFIRNWQK